MNYHIRLQIIFIKIIAFLGLVYLLEVPINTKIKFIALVFGAVFIYFSKLRKMTKLQVTGIMFTAVIAVFLRSIETPSLNEAHNIFLGDGKSLVSRDILTPGVFNEIDKSFESKYPKSSWCDESEPGCWRQKGADKLQFKLQDAWAYSSDGIFQNNKKWSRRVNDVNFEAEAFKMGAFNSGWSRKEMSTHIWNGDLRRDQIPFWVMYEIPQSFEGGQICTAGWIFKSKNINDFQSSISKDINCSTINPEHIGQKIIGVGGLTEERLSLKIMPASNILIARYLLQTGLLLAAFLLLVLVFQFQYFSFASLSLIITTIMSVKYFSYIDSFIKYPGGHDGLTHFGYSRAILMSLSEGNIFEALMGSEQVYYFMPGYRYFLSAAGLLFGDSQYHSIAFIILAYFAIVSMFTSLYYKYVGYILGFLSFVFLIRPILPHMSIYDGYSETLGYVFFVFGFSLVVKQLNLYKYENIQLFISGCFFSAAIFIRPNLVIGAFLVFAYVLFRFCREKKITSLFFYMLGLSLSLVMLFHNYIYDQKFILFTSAVGIPVNLEVSPMVWLKMFQFDGASADLVINHLQQWLSSPMKKILIILAIGRFFVSLSRSKTSNEILLLMATIGLSTPMLFYITTGRYSILAWLFTLIYVLNFALEYALDRLPKLKKFYLTQLK